MDSKVLFLFLTMFSLSCCAFSGKHRSVKGLYCKDPDTNILHTINSTWPSTTFCGNYTCKMRKTNLNLTNIETNINTFDNKKLTTSQLKQSEYTNTQEKRTMNNSPKEFYYDGKPKIKAADRFLTRNEIKEIADILQNVKISDLEALLELYSVAKEVYNDIDKDDIKKTQRINELLGKSQRMPQKSDSTYWYDPHYNLKKMKELDLKTDESNAYPVQKNIKTSEPLYYFNGGFSSADFGKLPYYYPLSAFQRISSYIHDPKARQHNINNNLVQPLPTVAPIIYTAPPPNYNAIPKAFVPAVTPCKHNYYNHPINQGIPHTAIHENAAKESTISNLERNLLPFPFTNMQRENESKLQMPFFRINPWMEFLPTKHHLKPTQSSQPIARVPIGFSNLPAKPSNVPTFINPELEESSGEPVEEVPIESVIHADSIEDNIIPRSRINQNAPLPDWKTEDLPREILEEIRANVLQKSNMLLTPFPLKKSKIKLENLGKLFKLEKNTRKKREVNENFDEFKNKETDNVYEAYIEKTVCKADYSIGYFSVGNSSQPYPRCCPQRVEPTTTTTETSKAP